MTITDRPGLLEVIAAFFAAEREAGPGQVCLGPCDRAEPLIDPELQADTYVTEVWCPLADTGIQRLYSPMKADPEAEAEI
jgi:hypothetical protein